LAIGHKELEVISSTSWALFGQMNQGGLMVPRQPSVPDVALLLPSCLGHF
jgi:hypothetical protein